MDASWMQRTRTERAIRVRDLWWARIRHLSAEDAREALLQMLSDMDEHWDKEHEEDGLPEDLGIPPDEYLTKLLDRIRRARPPDSDGA